MFDKYYVLLEEENKRKNNDLYMKISEQREFMVNTSTDLQRLQYQCSITFEDECQQ